MTQKDPYIPILVGLGPKLWSVTLKLCQRAKLSVPNYVTFLKKNPAKYDPQLRVRKSNFSEEICQSGHAVRKLGLLKVSL